MGLELIVPRSRQREKRIRGIVKHEAFPKRRLEEQRGSHLIRVSQKGSCSRLRYKQEEYPVERVEETNILVG